MRPRTGALWEHDSGVLPGGGGSADGVRRDAGLDVRRRAEVEGRPGLKGQRSTSDRGSQTYRGVCFSPVVSPAEV